MKSACFLVVSLLALAAGGAASAQTQTVVVASGGGSSRTTKAAKRPTGWVSTPPPLLLAARKVFVSNLGSDAGLFPHPFTGTQDRAYGRFCDKLDDNDHFERVDAPAEADLVLEVTLLAPPGSVSGDKSKGTGDALPTFKLVAYDRPTHYVLWTVQQTVDEAKLQKTHDRNLDTAIDSVVTQFLAVAVGKPIEPAVTAPKTEAP